MGTDWTSVEVFEGVDLLVDSGLECRISGFFFFSCLKAYSPAVTFLIQHFKPGEKRDLKITEHKEKDNSRTDR